jgi:hypothetical protein
MLNVKPPTLDQISLAIAGSKKDPQSIAMALAKLAEDQAAIARREEEEFQEALAGIRSTYTPIRQNLSLSTAETIRSETNRVVREHAEAVKATIAQNKALISSTAATVLMIGTSIATGGMTAPAAVPAFLQLATQISASLGE